jgi:competence protein ComER
MKQASVRRGEALKVCFIGTGSMGSLLTEAFLKAGALSPEQVTLASRTRSKAEALAARYPGLAVADDNLSAASDANLIFLCVKPSDFRAVLDDILPVLTKDRIIVSITSPIRIETLEKIVPSKVAKIIPSVVNSVGCGATLFMFGARLNDDDRALLRQLFSSISRPVEIDEEKVRVASDLSSVGPAFFAFLLERFIEAAVAETGINRETATTLACEMLLGTARMLQEPDCSPADLQRRVSVPGGITAAALAELDRATKNAFSRVLQTTHAKFKEDMEKAELSLRPQKRRGPRGNP